MIGLAAAKASGQTSQPTPSSDIAVELSYRAPDSEEVRRAKLYGQILYTKTTVSFDQTPIREVISTLRGGTGIKIIGRFSDDPVGFGIDAGTRITLDAKDRPVREILEEILEQCSTVQECTWQLRKGFVEVGTKERLAVPSARETRLYDVKDQMLQPPSFKPGGIAVRALPLENVVALVKEVCETIEPGRWDYGQHIHVPEEERLPSDTAPLDASSSGAAPEGQREADKTRSTGAPAEPPSGARRAQLGVPMWASIRAWRGNLIVHAPDFIHREIVGYPDPIPPEGVDPAAITTQEPDTNTIDWRIVP
jgi:hypothetical protein